MVLPNWVKVAWWLLLLAGLTGLLWFRRLAIVHGASTAFDALAFVFWICLMLVPIFSEIKIFGFEFKQELEELKRHINQQLTSLTSEIHNSVDFRTQISPQFHLA